MHEKKIEAEVVLQGEAFAVIADLRNLRYKANRIVRLKGRVKYPGGYWNNSYDFCPIQNGHGEEAKQKLQGLFQQGAVTGEQFDYYLKAIEEAETATA